jgi:uncharacterized protein
VVLLRQPILPTLHAPVICGEGHPLAYLAPSDVASFDWRIAFIDTFVERDLRNFGLNLPPMQVHRFWTMVAHYHGQVWNGS